MSSPASAASAAWTLQSDLGGLVTLGIKHTSAFERRQKLLLSLLESIRRRYGTSLRIVVADDGDGDEAHRAALRGQGVEVLVLAASAGLSHGRNELVRVTRTPFVALLDDDLIFHANTSLATLVGALQADPDAALAGGCYVEVRSTGRASVGLDGCYNLRFDVAAGGAAMHMRPAPPAIATSAARPRCHRVHVTHNFFVARTAALRRFRWDPRQKMMEHESFFLQLFLHQQPVLACPSVTVLHHTKSLGTDKNYSRLSLRFKEQRFAQFLCKNFPELARLTTPFAQWHCRMHVFCTPAWWSQFAFDGSDCTKMHFAPSDDASAVELPLVSPVIHSEHLYRRVTAPSSHHVPLLIVVTTSRERAAMRQRQRASWLTYSWHQSHLSREGVPWRFLYAMPSVALHDGNATTTPAARASPAQSSTAPIVEPRMDRLMGDSVTLGAVPPVASAATLAIEALRWVLGRVSFDALLLTDDTSIVHVGRLWAWLIAHATVDRTTFAAGVASLVAGTPAADGRSELEGSDILLGRDACSRAVRRFDARTRKRLRSPPFTGSVGGVAVTLARSATTREDEHGPVAIPAFVRQAGTKAVSKGMGGGDPVILRGHAVDATPQFFRKLLMSESCYGQLGVPIACPKTMGGGGFELSNRPWRDAPLDDVQALALTPVVNKQLLRYLGRGKGTAP